MTGAPLLIAALSAGCAASLALRLWPGILPAPPSAGERGRRRLEALRARGLFALAEPLIRALARGFSSPRLGGLRRWAEVRLTQAGRPLGLDGDELFACSALAAVAGALAGYLLCAVAGRNAGAGLIAGAVLGAALPLLKVDELARARRLAVCRGLPQAIDLLAMAMKAGLDFTGAVRQASGQLGAGNPLRFELEQILERLSYGWARQDALEALAERIPDPPVRQFTSAVQQAERQGTPLARVLGQQAEVLRLNRSQAAERAAARAAVWILGPLMLIFACVFLILLGPFAIRFFRGDLF